MGYMALRRDRKVATTHPQAGLEEAIREEQDFLDRRYPADWDYYEEVVAKNPPNGEVTIPHRITGDPVRIDLLTVTPDEIIEQCGFPDHLQEQSGNAERTSKCPSGSASNNRGHPDSRTANISPIRHPNTAGLF